MNKLSARPRRLCPVYGGGNLNTYLYYQLFAISNLLIASADEEVIIDN